MNHYGQEANRLKNIGSNFVSNFSTPLPFLLIEVPTLCLSLCE